MTKGPSKGMKLYGIIDTREKIILPIEYKHIIRMEYDKNVFIVTKGDNYAFVKIRVPV